MVRESMHGEAFFARNAGPGRCAGFEGLGTAAERLAALLPASQTETGG